MPVWLAGLLPNLELEGAMLETPKEPAKSGDQWAVHVATLEIEAVEQSIAMSEIASDGQDGPIRRTAPRQHCPR